MERSMDGTYSEHAPLEEKKSQNVQGSKALDINSKQEEFQPTQPQVPLAANSSFGGNILVINMPDHTENPGISVDNETDDTFKSFEFNDKSIRRAFVSKVYGIILTQLIITAAFIAWFTCHEPTKLFIRQNLWIMLPALMFYITSFLVMICFEPARRKVPFNYVSLFVFTVSLSVLVGAACTNYKAMEVLQAFGITMVIVVSLTIFACQTKFDFTMLNGSLFVALLVLILFGLIAAITRSATLHLLYCGLGVLFFSIFLVYDTQLIISGSHKYKISPEEYVFAALCIYLDIVNIFIRVLRLMRS